MSSGQAFLLAFDVGTSSLKGVIYDHAGKIKAAATARYENSFPQTDWAEANPDDWWNALLEVCDDLRNELPSYAAVEAISLTGQMHTAVLLDEHGQPLQPTILWLDRRAAAETTELQQTFQLPPYHLNSTYTLPKLFWLARHRPDVIARARHLLFPKDYLRYRLTGEIFTDYTEAGGAALLDWQRMDWARERLEYTGISPRILPPLRQATDDAGALLPEVTMQLGLAQETRVFIGVGDVLALVTGAPPAEGRVTCSLGSSSMIFCPISADKDIRDEKSRIYVYPLLPYKLLGGVSSTTGAALQWAWQALFGDEINYEGMISAARQAPPGAGGVIFLPFLSGERSPYWNDNLRGAFYGLGLTHTRMHLVRAVMEGIAFSLRYLCDVFNEVGAPVKEIALAGGGASVAGLAQMFATICKIPVTIYAGQETVTHGLYAYACQKMQAGVDFKEALLRTFQPPVRIFPETDQDQIYARLYARYQLLADFAHQSLSTPE